MLQNSNCVIRTVGARFIFCALGTVDEFIDRLTEF